ncbi:MAG: hypothetical protein JWP34_325 [Massilia sp.]|jgi:hypothetical protein|nr:hypothetical protein [Massilia sp.]
MKRFRPLLLAVAGVPFAISAQTIGPIPKVTDANAPVPPGPSEHALHGATEIKEPAPVTSAAEKVPAHASLPTSDVHTGHHLYTQGQ